MLYIYFIDINTMQNVGTILNLSILYQLYLYSSFFFQISRSILSLPPKKRTKITSNPSFRISSNKSIPGISYLSKDRKRGCVETNRKRILPLDGGRSLTCRVLILKFRVAREGVPSSPLREKRGESSLPRIGFLSIRLEFVRGVER